MSPKWIAPYIKGPDGAPLKKDRVPADDFALAWISGSSSQFRGGPFGT